MGFRIWGLRSRVSGAGFGLGACDVTHINHSSSVHDMVTSKKENQQRLLSHLNMKSHAELTELSEFILRSVNNCGSNPNSTPSKNRTPCKKNLNVRESTQGVTQALSLELCGCQA